MSISCGAQIKNGIVHKALSDCFASTALGTTLLGLSLFVNSHEASAACIISTNPNSVACGTQTSTTDTQNSNATNPTSVDRYQVFDTAGNVVVNVSNGPPTAVYGIVGNGLAIETKFPTGAINVTNDSTIQVNTGNTPTAGGNAAALSLATAGGGIVYSGAGSVVNNGTTSGADAILAIVGGSGLGNIDITTNGGILTNGGVGILARNNGAGGGTINITQNAVIVRNGACFCDGIDAFTTGTGGITVTSSADISGTNIGGGIYAESIGPAIVGPAYAANVSVALTGANIGSALNAAEFDGIVARIYSAANAGDVKVNLNNASIWAANNGEGGEAVYANTNGDGNVTVTGTGTGSLIGVNGAGIFAGSNAGKGNVSVDVTQDVSGTFGIAAQTRGTGNIVVTARGNVNANSGNGIDIANLQNTATAGTINVTLVAGKTITATGNFGTTGITDGNGINLDSGISTGLSTINVNGEIIAQNAGIFAKSTTGDIITNVAATGIIDPLIGIDQTTASGALTVNNAGLIEGDQIGVRLNSTGFGSPIGALTVAQTGAGKIQVTGAGGASAQAVLVRSGSADINVTGNGNASIIDASNGTNAIDARSFDGNITITDNQIIGATTGILARSDFGNILINGTGDITGISNAAIDAILNADGDAGTITIDRTGTILGKTGIRATSSGNTTGVISVTANGNVTATNGQGIVADNTSSSGPGNVNVTLTAGHAINAIGGSGIEIDTRAAASVSNSGAVQGAEGLTAVQTGSVSISGSGSFRGTSGAGINVATTAGKVDILSTGAVSGGNFGIIASSTGGDVTIAGVGPVFAAAGSGIAAQALSGVNDVSVSTASTVTGGTNGDGIQAIAVKNGKVSVTNGGLTQATSLGMGIDAQSEGGIITLQSNAAVMGVAAGISGLSNTADIAITANGNAIGTGGGSRGIQAKVLQNGPGTISITQAAGTTAEGTAGIVAQTFGTGSISINAAGNVIGTGDAGIGVTTAAASPVSITTAGIVTGLAQAISTTMGGGTLTLNNSGTLNGSIYTLGANIATSVFTNLGTWNNGSQTSQINGSLANSGTISTVDGVAGNTAIIVAGNYVGNGGTLKVDTVFNGANPTSDKLFILGNSSGNTKVAINDTNVGLGTSLPTGIPVVIVNGQSTASDFVLDGGTFVKGFFAYRLQYDAGDFYLASTQTSAISSPATLVPGLQSIWQTTAAGNIGHLEGLRDLLVGGQFVTAVADPPLPENASNNSWVEALGNWNHRSSTMGNAYDQSIYGLQGGFDFGINSGTSHLIWGLSGAYYSSNIAVNDGFGSNTAINGGALAVDATFLNKGFFADAVAEVNFARANLNIAGFSAATDTRTFGGRADVGYRFGKTYGWFIEPMASVAATHTDIDPFVLSGVNYSGSGDDLRAGLGARFGLKASDLSLSMTTRLWDHIKSGSTFAVVPLGPAFNVTDPGLFNGVSAEIAGKASYNISPRTNLFLNGMLQSDGHSSSISANTGVSFKW